MKISFGTRISKLEGINNANGYGYATNCMLDSLQRLGYHVSPNDASADVEIWFDQPHHWDFSPGTYKIGYHPWESTLLQPGWADIMNRCDEIWTPSPLIADWYRRYAGVRVPVYVYEHGIEHEWFPAIRQPEHTIKFLHVGAEAARKGGWDTVRLFRRAFQGRNDTSLTLKMINSNWNGLSSLGKVKYVNEKIGFKDLQKMFYLHDVYVYPSWGEGFGLTPLQALGSGMPTITLPAWAPYADFLDPNLSVNSKLQRSNWPKIHPGQMFRPKEDDVVEAMRYAADNYDEVRDFAASRATEIHARYDWDNITQQVFSALENRLNQTKNLSESSRLGTPIVVR